MFGLPAQADTPADPHASFTHLHNYPIDGGLVDGPVYGSIYKNRRGIALNTADEYAPFQSELVVYHDDFGDYATNEPTMDGTASLIYLLAAQLRIKVKTAQKQFTCSGNRPYAISSDRVCALPAARGTTAARAASTPAATA